MVKFPRKNIYGMAKSGEKVCGIVIFGNDSDVKVGDSL